MTKNDCLKHKIEFETYNKSFFMLSHEEKKWIHQFVLEINCD